MGTVREYLETVDPAVRPALERVVARAREMVPDVEEGTSYGMPALLHQGKPLVAVVQTKKHLALYPFSGSVVSLVDHRLEGFSLSSGTIRFSADHAIPDDVLDDVIRLRRDEIEHGRR